jgi:hypothetical protein
MNVFAPKDVKIFIELHNALSNEVFANLIDDFFESSTTINISAEILKNKSYYLIKKLPIEKKYVELLKLKYVIPKDKNPLLAGCILRCKYKDFMYNEYGLKLSRKELCLIIESSKKRLCTIM